MRQSAAVPQRLDQPHGEVGPNQCQPTHWEAEYESRNFQTHMHPLNGCDGIVCWINNWPECPLEVIELKSVVERLAKA